LVILCFCERDGQHPGPPAQHPQFPTDTLLGARSPPTHTLSLTRMPRSCRAACCHPPHGCCVHHPVFPCQHQQGHGGGWGQGTVSPACWAGGPSVCTGTSVPPGILGCRKLGSSLINTPVTCLGVRTSGPEVTGEPQAGHFCSRTGNGGAFMGRANFARCLLALYSLCFLSRDAACPRRCRRREVTSLERAIPPAPASPSAL